MVERTIARINMAIRISRRVKPGWVFWLLWFVGFIGFIEFVGLTGFWKKLIQPETIVIALLLSPEHLQINLLDIV